MTQFRHDFRPLQLFPDKALHFMHQRNPDMLVLFHGHVICSLEGSDAIKIKIMEKV